VASQALTGGIGGNANAQKVHIPAGGPRCRREMTWTTAMLVTHASPTGIKAAAARQSRRAIADANRTVPTPASTNADGCENQTAVAPIAPKAR